MRFNVNGQYLELPDDFSLQFKKTNILFAFDNMECERSTSFDIPATPQNDRIFALSRQVQNVGTGMRKRYDAELQGSGVTKRGYLYVSSADKSAYNAVFVTGELLGLQAIRNAGKLEDFLHLTDTADYSVNGYSPSIGESSIWTGVNYKRPAGALIRPSIRLGQLYDTIFTTLGVTHSQIPAEAASIRIIPSEIKGIKQESVTLTENSRARKTL